jgi:hypothetical protein
VVAEAAVEAVGVAVAVGEVAADVFPIFSLRQLSSHTPVAHRAIRLEGQKPSTKELRLSVLRHFLETPSKSQPGIPNVNDYSSGI